MNHVHVCIPNIGPRERRRRLIGGIALLVFAAVAAFIFMWSGAPRLWRLLVFLPAWAGALGVFQVAEKTCVALAARGLRNMDEGDVAITNAAELEQVRLQSAQVHRRALLTAALVAVVITMLPF